MHKCVLHLYCSVQLSMSNAEKHYWNKIIVIIIIIIKEKVQQIFSVTDVELHEQLFLS